MVGRAATHAALERLHVADKLRFREDAVALLAIALAELPPSRREEEVGDESVPLVLLMQVLWHALLELRRWRFGVPQRSAAFSHRGDSCRRPSAEHSLQRVG